MLRGPQTACSPRIWLHICSQDHSPRSHEAKINPTIWISRGSWQGLLGLLLKSLTAIGSQQTFKIKTACHRKPRSRKQCQGLLLKQQDQAISEREETTGEVDFPQRHWAKNEHFAFQHWWIWCTDGSLLQPHCNDCSKAQGETIGRTWFCLKIQTDYSHAYSYTYNHKYYDMFPRGQPRCKHQGPMLLPVLLSTRWKKDASCLPPPSWTLRFVSIHMFCMSFLSL